MEVPISVAKRIAKELGADAVIVIAFGGAAYATTSYGKDRPTCRQFSKVCDRIHEDIGDGTIPIDLPWWMMYDRYWRIRKWHPERFGQRLRVVARGKLNSALIEFYDGHRMITNRNYFRKVQNV